MDTTPKETVKLINVFLHVTKACNLRCDYCYFSASNPLPDEMTTEEFERLWPDLVDIHPQKVIFTGGEPILRPDILNLLKGMRDADAQHSVLRCLNTNGHFITRELARKLVGLVDEVRVSLDALPERNDSLRGKGNFEAAMRALEYLYEVGFEPKVLVTITSKSLPDLEGLLSLLARKRITQINLNGFRPIGRGSSHRELIVKSDHVRKVLRQTGRQSYDEEPVQSDSLNLEQQSTCGVGSFLNIMPNGDVFPCHVLTKSEFRCGNVREQSLLEICNRNSLIGHLAALDFIDLARQDERASPLAVNGTCMGEVYSATRSLSVWTDILPFVQLAQRKPGT